MDQDLPHPRGLPPAGLRDPCYEEHVSVLVIVPGDRVVRLMDAPKSSVRSAAYEGGVQDHPHDLGYTAIDEETGDVVERVEALPCRRCAEYAS